MNPGPVTSSLDEFTRTMPSNTHGRERPHRKRPEALHLDRHRREAKPRVGQCFETPHVLHDRDLSA